MFHPLSKEKYSLGVSSKEVSVPGMGAAAFICLVATAISMADADRFAKICLALFALAGLVFYISVAMPFRIKRRSR